MEHASDLEYRSLLVEQDGPATRITSTARKAETRCSLELLRNSPLRCATPPVPETRVIVIEAAGPAFSAGHDLSEMIGRDARVLRRAVRRVHRADGDDPRAPAAGDRQGARRRHRRGLPARGRLRPRGGRRERAVRDARRQDRAVLLDADGAGARGRSGASARWRCCSPASRSTPPTALDWGLVNRVVPAERARGRGRRARRARSRASSPLTVAIGKQAFYDQVDARRADAYEHARRVMAMNAVADDAQEGMSAFLEKRAPTWRGR